MHPTPLATPPHLPDERDVGVATNTGAPSPRAALSPEGVEFAGVANGATKPRSEPSSLHSPIIHDGSGTLAAVQSLSYIIIVAIFTVTFSLQPFRIPSASMEPTLLVGDFLLVDKQQPATSPSRSNFSLDPLPASSIHRGDVIVFHYPLDPSLHLVKRVIGLPGDRLRMRNGRVFINDSPLAEPYAVYTRSRRDLFRDDFPHLATTDPDVSSQWWSQMQRLVDHGDLRIPQDEFFVLGDNRNDSEDSRYWGFVPRAAIVGQPFLVYFSLRDSAGQADLPRDTTDPQPRPSAHRTPAEAFADLARWHRVLHVIH